MPQYNSIISELADIADELFSGLIRPDDVRERYEEYLQERYPELKSTDRKQIIEETITVLTEEDFFNATPGEILTDDDSDDMMDSEYEE